MPGVSSIWRLAFHWPGVSAHLERLGHDIAGFDRADGDDLLDPATVTRAADGCAALVHLGAINHDTAGSPEDIMVVNVLGPGTCCWCATTRLGVARTDLSACPVAVAELPGLHNAALRRLEQRPAGLSTPLKSAALCMNIHDCPACKRSLMPHAGCCLPVFRGAPLAQHAVAARLGDVAQSCAAVVVAAHDVRAIPADGVIALYQSAGWWPQRTARQFPGRGGLARGRAGGLRPGRDRRGPACLRGGRGRSCGPAECRNRPGSSGLPDRCPGPDPRHHAVLLTGSRSAL